MEAAVGRTCGWLTKVVAWTGIEAGSVWAPVEGETTGYDENTCGVVVTGAVGRAGYEAVPGAAVTVGVTMVGSAAATGVEVKVVAGAAVTVGVTVVAGIVYAGVATVVAAALTVGVTVVAGTVYVGVATVAGDAVAADM